MYCFKHFHCALQFIVSIIIIVLLHLTSPRLQLSLSKAVTNQHAQTVTATINLPIGKKFSKVINALYFAAYAANVNIFNTAFGKITTHTGPSLTCSLADEKFSSEFCITLYYILSTSATHRIISTKKKNKNALNNVKTGTSYKHGATGLRASTVDLPNK